MLKNLHLNNVGPASDMKLDLKPRLNVLTGDNGLGKSFLLDIMWWSLTRTWPSEVNAFLTSGKKALPHPKKTGIISSTFSSKNKTDHLFESKFVPKEQQWEVGAGRPPMPGLVFYAMSDGSFAAWDPARNYWKNRKAENGHHIPAYVFSPTEVWDGLKSHDGKWLCNGVIRDWATWQREKGDPYKRWNTLLKHFSPPSERFQAGDLTRIDLDDVRDMPTLRTSYGHDVAIVHASSGIRRIIALAYFLLWGWQEHLRACDLIRSERSNQVIFLIDEIEAHLHPSWQRVIVPAVLSVMEGLLHKKANVQLITATHSPLVMSSIEPEFNDQTDAWFDIDFEKEGKRVILQKRDFERLGEVDAWLTGEAFDLDCTRAPQYRDLLNEASSLLYKEKRTKKEVEAMTKKLVGILRPGDPFLVRWNFFCVKEGLIK